MYFWYAVMRPIIIIFMIISYSTVLMLGVAGNKHLQQPAIAIKIESNFTSTTCVDNKPCVTRICINNEPCHIITSNSTHTDNNSTNNKKKNAIAPSFPQASI
jgi:hypothetical protein